MTSSLESFRRPWSAWESYLLVFVTSLCTLVLEIVAGRVLAPTIGVSLYTWTSIIGVVLAGIAAGNYLGGLAARRVASATALALLLLATGLAVWLVAVVSRTNDVDRLFADLAPLTRIVWLSAMLFFLPSLLLGAVTPLVAQLTLRERANAGAVVGRLGAFSATGSIVGTFLTGFVLIPTFGTRTILFGVAAVLLLLALLTIAGRISFGGRTAIVLFLGVTVVSAPTAYALTQDANACLRESAYYCIRLSWSSVGEIPYSIVRHDRVVQGYTAPSAPRLLMAEYIRTFADVAVYHELEQKALSAGAGTVRSARAHDPLQVLFIGGGSYTLPRYLEAVEPSSQLDVLEIDPEVTQTARAYLGLRLDGAIRVRHGDARLAIAQLPDEAYDLVYGDAFSDLSVPWHLTTVEFDYEVERVLRPDGLYVVNVIDTWEEGRFLAAYVRTLQTVFPQVAVLRVREGNMDELRNWVVVGSRYPINPNQLANVRRPGLNGLEQSSSRVVEAQELSAWLAARSGQSPVLTDDYAPVDWLLSRQAMRY